MTRSSRESPEIASALDDLMTAASNGMFDKGWPANDSVVVNLYAVLDAWRDAALREERRLAARLLCELGYAIDPRFRDVVPVDILTVQCRPHKPFVGKPMMLTDAEVETILAEYRSLAPPEGKEAPQ